MTDRDEALVDEALKGFDREPWLSFARQAAEVTTADMDRLTEVGEADPQQAHAAQFWFRAQLALMKAAGGRGNADSTRFRTRVQSFGAAAQPSEGAGLSRARIYTYQAAMAFASKHLVGTRRYTQAHYDLLTRPWREAIGDPSTPAPAPRS